VYREVSDSSGHLDLEIALSWRSDLQSPLVHRVVGAVRAQ